jgi:hypothetical protein
MVGGQLHRLNALQVSKEVAPGYYADGGGLYLQISTSGSRSWIFRFTIAGRSREMGLGPLSLVSLATVRRGDGNRGPVQAASGCGLALAAGILPAFSASQTSMSSSIHALRFGAIGNGFGNLPSAIMR